MPPPRGIDAGAAPEFYTACRSSGSPKLTGADVIVGDHFDIAAWSQAANVTDVRKGCPSLQRSLLARLEWCLAARHGKRAETIQAPMAICGNSVLAAATLATQGLVDVVIDGRCFPLSEIFMSIGESGERKSAVDKAALWPHRDYENVLRQKYEEQFSDYNRAADAYGKTRDKAIQASKSKTYQDKKKALDALKDVEPRKPLEPFLICEEPTYEGLVKMLAHGQPSIGLFSDEGGRVIGGHGMNNDNLLKTASGMSGLWGGRAISRVRAGDGAALIPGRRVSCHLMAQPDVSRLMLSNAMLLEQGLLSRCLVTWPPSTAGTRIYREIKAYLGLPRLMPFISGSLLKLETHVPK